MVTFWQTTSVPNMDNPLMRPSAQSLQRPQVFVKVEFGVSWSGQHSPRTHGIEFKSRALRERHSGFPRTVPAPTTNYLVAAPPPSVQQSQGGDAPHYNLHYAPREQAPSRRTQQYTEFRGIPSYDTSYLLPAPYFHERSEPRHIEAIPEPPPLGPFPPEERRQSRAERAASPADRHQRGNSAPPPLSDNNWDVVSARYLDEAATGQPSTAHRAGPQARTNSDVWKDLPEVPSRFRLGEDDMPWDGTWQFPMGFEPFLEPDPYLRPSSAASPKPSPEHSSRRPRTPEQQRRPIVESPPQGDDPARRHELEALGHAMMTVDNGFENQWWNQGERKHLTAVTPPPATRQQMEEQMALGWVGALLPAAGPGDDSNKRFTYPTPETTSVVSPEGSIGASYNNNNSSNNMMVSPISTFSVPTTQLSRTLSTRSDELWFGRGAARYA